MEAKQINIVRLTYQFKLNFLKNYVHFFDKFAVIPTVIQKYITQHLFSTHATHTYSTLRLYILSKYLLKMFICFSRTRIYYCGIFQLYLHSITAYRAIFL